MAHITNESTLGEVREHLSTNLSDGLRCPACEQNAKAYRRTIHATMAANLITAYREHYQRPFRPIDLLGATSPDFVKLRFWDLLSEVDPEMVRKDGSPRTGRWAITARGITFIRGIVEVKKYALVYNNRLLRLEGPPVTIRAALGSKFSYEELMED
jgi:hypothetical protein